MCGLLLTCSQSVRTKKGKKKSFSNYVNPSIPKDKIFWVMNLKNITHWKSIVSSRSPPINFVRNIRAHVMLFFENRSFHHDRPEKFRSKYLNIAPNCAQRGKCLYVEMFPTMWTYFPSLERNMFLNIAPKQCPWTIIHQPRPQYALRTIDHTTLSVGHYPLVVLNTF